MLAAVLANSSQSVFGEVLMWKKYVDCLFVEVVVVV